MHQRKYPTEGNDLGLTPPGNQTDPIKMPNTLSTTNIFSPSKRLLKSGKRRKPGDRPFMWATAGRRGSSNSVHQMPMRFRTSDWYRPNSRAIREGVTPALKLPEWHLADTASMMAALLPVPGEMMAGRSGTVVPGAGCKIAAQT